jgi:hypothetical protein
VSDLWLIFHYIFFCPGDSLIDAIKDTDFGKFFELSEQSYGGPFSGFVSFLAWLWAGAILFNFLRWLGDIRDGFSEWLGRNRADRDD